ncbi:MAG: tRNA pseudouridine(55) synthase TruB [Holosporaceae bacterium]|jgi:tRNA pseudouridine55 synthase|nr:tRNA pseudouridine(55) synthase TruB [Holosporaceae bacterium]
MQSSNYFNGWLCLDKPEEMSSNFAMTKVRRILRTPTGYVGTLDPFATGVLPIAVGEARKFIRFIEKSEKTYRFTMAFGKTTDTLDKNGKITAYTDNIPQKSSVLGVLNKFLGETEQIPPAFSAIKLNGKRACDRVRLGEPVELSPKKINIFAIKVINEDLPKYELSLEVTCSKGTYMRGLARDIAEELGSLAYVKTLCRIKSGFFSLNNAITLEKLSEIKDTHKMKAILASVESPLDDIPALYLRSEGIAVLRNGVQFRMKNLGIISSNVKIFDDINKVFCGVGYVSDDGTVKAVRMCNR